MVWGGSNQPRCLIRTESKLIWRAVDNSSPVQRSVQQSGKQPQSPTQSGQAKEGGAAASHEGPSHGGTLCAALKAGKSAMAWPQRDPATPQL